MMKLFAFIVLATAALVQSQRPSFAGTRPIGYPEYTPTEAALGDRFGEVDGTTQRLPIEANGDRDLIDRLSKLPVDKQPFWFINWQALEAHRQNPQTFPQKPNPFVDPAPITGNANLGSSGFQPGINSAVNPNPSFNSGTSIASSVPSAGNLNSGSSVSNGVSGSNAGSLNAGNSSSSSNVPNVANRNSEHVNTANKNTVVSDNRFGGIEPNNYTGDGQTNVSTGSNHKPGSTVNVASGQKINYVPPRRYFR